MTIDEVELELRRLDGVHATGFSEQDDVLWVQICVDADVDDALVATATKIAAGHADRLVAVELVRTRPATVPEEEPSTRHDGSPAGGGEVVVIRPEPRLELLAVLVFPETNELEVHLAFDGRRVVGRAEADRALPGAVDATLEAVREFVPDFSLTATWAHTVEAAAAGAPIVAVGLLDPESSDARFGIARAGRPGEAAAKATLQAVNRTIAPDLR